MKFTLFHLAGSLCFLPLFYSSTPSRPTRPTPKRTTTEEIIITTTKQPTEDDLYINYFGNEGRHNYRMWTAMKRVYYEENNGTLHKLCADTHKQAHKNNTSPIKVKCAYIHPKILGFEDIEYYPIRIDVVTCEIEEMTEEGNVTSVFHMTEGRSPECVYLLKPSLLAVMHFTLGDLICDIPIDDTFDVQPRKVL